MAVAALTSEQMNQLAILSTKLGTDESTALSKALTMADYIVDTDADPNSALLVKQGEKYIQLKLKR